MDHSHVHSHAQHEASGLRTAFFLNLSFTILELVGGLFTNSVAIVSDALHDLGDTISLGLSWFLARYAQKRGDDRYSYGYRRYSLLGALLNAVVLIVGGLIVLSEAVPRIIQPEETHAPGMIVLALVGITVNGLAAWRLQREQSLNARLVGLHLLEDVLGWVAVLAVSVILLFSDLYVLDPILSILITVLVLIRVIRRLQETVSVFMQAVPKGFDLKRFEKRLHAIDKVLATHHTHVWSLDGEHHILTTHIIVPPDASKADICDVKSAVVGLIDSVETVEFEHTTIEIEYEDETCRMRV